MNQAQVAGWIVAAASLVHPPMGGVAVAGESGARRAGDVSHDALTSTRFRAVDPNVTEHPREVRGFVAVPLDYANPSGRQIRIFYRLMPSRSSAADDTTSPILVVMNGGPGVASSTYRSLDHDYGGAEQNDAFRHLAKYFRILAVDQRGTGNSAPLDLADSTLSPEVIARFFDSDEHARDHARVIEAVIPKRERFFILARSYGGEIGFQYLTLGDDFRRPEGMIFDSAVLPHGDGLETFLVRRRRQRELNLELRADRPQAVAKLARLRGHLAALGMDPNDVNYLWPYLGKTATWKAELEERIDALLGMRERAEVAAELGSDIRDTISLLNYVLSSASLTPGHTDRTMSQETSRRVPFEPWMLDENRTLTTLGMDGTWRGDFVESVDRNPPPPVRLPPFPEIRRALGTMQTLFTFGRGDALLPQEMQIRRARRLFVPGHTQFRVFEAGHGAAFSEEGAAAVREWASAILGRRPPGGAHDHEGRRQ